MIVVIFIIDIALFSVLPSSHLLLRFRVMLGPEGGGGGGGSILLRPSGTTFVPDCLDMMVRVEFCRRIYRNKHPQDGIRLRTSGRARQVLSSMAGLPLMLRYGIHLPSLISAQANETKECTLPMADYMECLHHVNEVARLRQVKQEMLKQEHKQGIKPKTQKEMMELAQ